MVGDLLSVSVVKMRRIVWASLFAAALPLTAIADNSTGLVTFRAVFSALGYAPMPHLATNAALKAFPSSAISILQTWNGAPVTVERDGFSAPGDGGRAKYVYSASACTLNSGAGDNGAQVYPNSGSGCWNVDWPPSGLSPQVWGPAGTGLSDDTATLTAAFAASGALGKKLVFDAVHLYEVTGPIAVSTPVTVEGPYRYGFWTTTANNSGRSCPWGITSTANTDILQLSGVTGRVQNLCIQAGATTSATAGAAINLSPPDVSHYQTGWHIEGVTILNPYDGITVNGAGATSTCCGAGTAADGISINRNTITSPRHAALSIGANTANAETVGITAWDNSIGCITTESKASGIGVLLADGALNLHGTDNGSETCNIGIKVAPGTAGGMAQNAQITASGVLGDQSGSYGLVLQPATTLGTVSFAQFTTAWSGDTGTGTTQVLISTANGGYIFNTTFTGGTYHSGPGQTVPVFDIEAGGLSNSSITNLTINGASIDCWNSGTCTAPAVKVVSKLGGDVMYVNVVNNRIGSINNGVFSTGIDLNTNPGAAYINVNSNIFVSSTGLKLTTPASGNASAVTVTGNNFFASSTPITYTPNPSDDVVIGNNVGVDDKCPSAAVSSGALTIPNAANCVSISTSGTPAVNSLGPPWQNRQIRLQSSASGGFTLATGGSTWPICRAASVAQAQVVTLVWTAGGTCWSTSL